MTSLPLPDPSALQMRSGLGGRERRQVLPPGLGCLFGLRLGALRRGISLGSQFLGILQRELPRGHWNWLSQSSGCPENFTVYKLIPLGMHPFALNVAPAIGGLGKIVGSWLRPFLFVRFW